LWLKRTFRLRGWVRVGFAAACLSVATAAPGTLRDGSALRMTSKPGRRAQIHLADGGYFDAPVDYCKAKTLVIQPGTLLWK
jgi:hypothetical protein